MPLPTSVTMVTLPGQILDNSSEIEIELITTDDPDSPVELGVRQAHELPTKRS